ncbi:MAG TPA: MBL fold metallo-hydrolase [Thiobacillaceae bacterium]|nr:MBL fold metallo-hydrolase [Thiobacillaceae bacterium]
MSSLPKLTFLNHASFQIETENSILIVDPWLQGTAFNEGWSLLDSSTSNERLAHELECSAKDIYIWYSHEHSDHFSVPFIKLLKKNAIKPTFIFQKTLDKRVSSFLKKDGFPVIEPSDGENVFVDDDLSIATWPYSGGDSFCLIRAQEWSILNINDCEVKTAEDAARVRAQISARTTKIDFLFTQFGYAHWIGNEGDAWLRQEASREIIARIFSQYQAFAPEFIIPFASFVYFCHPENFYMNDCQNSPASLRSAPTLRPIQKHIKFLKPYDAVELSDREDVQAKLDQLSPAAEGHWNHLAAKAQPVAPRSAANKSLDETREAFQAFKNKISKSFIFMPHLFELIGLAKPVNILLTDNNLAVQLSYLGDFQIHPDSDEWDVAMSTDTLNFILKNEYGFNATLINGRFRSKDGPSAWRFAMFFRPQDFLRNGLGIKHPYASARVFVNGLMKIIRRKLGFS